MTAPAERLAVTGLPRAGEPLRILALIYPVERYVGNWATSSPSIDLRRVLVEDDRVDRVKDEIVRLGRDHRPHAVAIIGKNATVYNDLLDSLVDRAPELVSRPRIYRCQNTVLGQKLAEEGLEPTPGAMASLSHWFASASDPRFAMVLVQTLDDVPLIAAALPEKLVIACPYGYDPRLFDPELPDLERPIDVGCYFNLRGDPGRQRLVAEARRICAGRGWRFQFAEGRYWHDYVEQIRTTKICLHQSIHSEIPFRLYETTSLGALFVTDPLRFGIDSLFELDREYLTFSPDFSDLESVLASVLEAPARWQTIRDAGRERARDYTWGKVVERYVVPALRQLLTSWNGACG